MKNIYLPLLVGLFCFPTVLISQTFTLAGTITRHNDQPLANTEISIVGITTSTDIDGKYALTNVPVGSFGVTPEAEYEKFEDISVLDWLVLNNAILNPSSFNFWQRLEGDVNNSTTLSPIDGVRAAKLALHQDDMVLPLYRFCDSEGVDICPDFIDLNPSPDTVIIQDFKAIRRADVAIDSDYFPPLAEAPSPIFFSPIFNFEANDNVVVDMTVQDFQSIAGFQHTLEWDPNLLELQNLYFHDDFNYNYNDQEIQNGKYPIIAISKNANPLSLTDGEIYISLLFTALQNSPNGGVSLQISDDLTPPQIVWQNPVDNELFIVEGEYLPVGSPNSVISVLNNIDFEIFPNPVHDFINTRITLENTENFKVKIVNTVGQKVYSRDFNEKMLDLKVDVKGYPKGIYFLSLESEHQVVTKSFWKN